MMKRYFILVVCITALFSACKKDENPNTGNNNEYVNNWIYNEMSIYYLWNIQMPRQPNYAQAPETFFESLLYNRKAEAGDRDRFSWIQPNYLELISSLQGIMPYDIGFEYVGYEMPSNEILGQIAYVKPNTDAERIGLKRGDLFTKVNGRTLNTTNWRDLLSGSETSVTISFINPETGVTTNKTINKIANYAENPVFFDNVYEVNGHKIGYLVYNFFAGGPTAENFSYDKKLNDIFGRFQSTGITELVLDLRYNSGGSGNSATLLASMIVPGLNVDNVLTKLNYNSLVETELIKEYGEGALVDKFRDRLNTGEMINNVGNSIQKLYVLTSHWTASASELVINGLKPYMPGKIFLIGNTTVGKNVGSISIYKENDPKNHWGMQPIVLRYFNKEGKADFSDGFTPDIVEYDNSSDKSPLGNPNEIMLKIAIDHITGNYSLSNISRSKGISRSLLGSSVEQKAWANKTIVDGSLLEKLNLNR